MRRNILHRFLTDYSIEPSVRKEFDMGPSLSDGEDVPSVLKQQKSSATFFCVARRRKEQLLHGFLRYVCLCSGSKHLC